MATLRYVPGLYRYLLSLFDNSFLLETCVVDLMSILSMS